MINLNYKDSRTIHAQIEDGFHHLIVGGVLKTHEKLPSVRELSISLTVNPNTVQKAYKELETAGFIYSIKGKGNFVAPVREIKNGERIDALYNQMRLAVKELIFLGESRENVEHILDGIFSQEEDE